MAASDEAAAGERQETGGTQAEKQENAATGRERANAAQPSAMLCRVFCYNIWSNVECEL